MQLRRSIRNLMSPTITIMMRGLLLSHIMHRRLTMHICTRGFLIRFGGGTSGFRGSLYWLTLTGMAIIMDMMDIMMDTMMDAVTKAKNSSATISVIPPRAQCPASTRQPGQAAGPLQGVTEDGTMLRRRAARSQSLQ